MTYFKINNNDYSMYVNKMIVAKNHIYKSMTNAAGNTLVKYVTSKRIIEVGIIPLDDSSMSMLQSDLNEFNVSISFLNPDTGALEENMNCILSDQIVEYYTIQDSNVKFTSLFRRSGNTLTSHYMQIRVIMFKERRNLRHLL